MESSRLHGLRDWSLITRVGGGGLQNGRGGEEVKFYPNKTWGGGGEKSCSQAEGEHKKCLGSFYAVA